MTDPWACSQCRSLNQPKATRCYKCRTPKAIASAAPTDLPTIGPAATVAPTGRYRSSAFRALFASFSILTLAIVGLIGMVFTTIVYPPIAIDGNAVVAEAALPLLLQLTFLKLGLVAASLVTFAAWISRVVDNIPPLTGSYPQATPRSTIVEVMIPFFNFFRIPAILREALRLLDPRGNGDAMIAAAILPLILGLLGDWPGGWIAGVIIGFTASTMDEAVSAVLAYSQVITALTTIGSVMLVMVIVRVERQSTARSRDRAQEREDFAATAVATI